jgi:DNA-binding XRE family transcriptional regulator
MKKIEKNQFDEELPTLTGKQFRFFREKCGLTRSQLGNIIQKSNETIRRIEVWYEDEPVKPIYTYNLYKAIDKILGIMY